MGERAIGTVTHYYSHLGVAAIALKGELKAGDTVHQRPHHGLYAEGRLHPTGAPCEEAAQGGENIGIKVMDRTRERDLVFRVTGE